MMTKERILQLRVMAADYWAPVSRDVIHTCLDEIEQLQEANEDLKVAARYWSEARSLIPEPSIPPTWAEKISQLRDAVCERDRLRRDLDGLNISAIPGLVRAVERYIDEQSSPTFSAMQDALAAVRREP
jgi:hypothetical protein